MAQHARDPSHSADLLRAFYGPIFFNINVNLKGVLTMSQVNPTLEPRIYPLAANDAASPQRYICFDDEKGTFVDITQHPVWKETQGFGQALVKRFNQYGLIIDTLRQQALEGRCYTMHAFARGFVDNPDFGGRGLEERLRQLAWAGCIKFFQNPQLYGLPDFGKGSYGYMCVQEMLFNHASAHIIRPIFPTHQLSITRPLTRVDNPWVWNEERN
jgi:hypothetical protein